jgi:hypothetical protein
MQAAVGRFWPRPWMRADVLDSPAGRVIVLGVTGGLSAVAIVWTISLIGIIAGHGGFGVDFQQYMAHTDRWLETGQFYLPRQLAGPTTVMDGDPLYPPVILWLLTPFAVIPPIAALWWAFPIGLTLAVIAGWRPAPWTWPLFGFILLWPRTEALVLYGNPGMWVVAIVAAATRWHWPGPWVLIKPSLAPFALIGVRHRGWWVALGVFLLACLPFGALWADYRTVLANSGAPLTYSLLDLPITLAPVVAYVGRTRS